ncbi:MAG: DNA-directed RNA polymerase subunit delta [Candidatus Phytoplasma pruni]|uniref:DNA-directed RNA polymerase subunit delta n=1 Tax=16SrIII (X-disease group) TaxID=85623 RepID=UPI00036641D4|nr:MULTISPECIES: DNA-directed RNA polymerase subunit delta [16SrIII (X-disease group)]
MKDEKNLIDPNNSMVDISYQILQQNKTSIPIYQLMEQVFQIKQLDFTDVEKVSQLYLDIVLSGLFVFNGQDLWCVKTDNLHLWDKEYYAEKDDKDDEEQTDIDHKILDFEDFTLKPKNNDIHDEDSDEHEEEVEEALDIDSEEHLDNDIKKPQVDLNSVSDDDDKEDDINDEYDYLYDK